MIVVELQGGLGNQMFQYALGRHLAWMNRVPLKLDVATGFTRDTFYRRKYALAPFRTIQEFASTRDMRTVWTPKTSYRLGAVLQRLRNLLPRFAAELVPAYGSLVHTEKRWFAFDAAVLRPATNHVLIRGYWQNEKYFREIAPMIRKEFTLRQEMSRGASAYRQAIGSSTSVALHVRRLFGRAHGKFSADAESLHGCVNADYYHAAMVEIERRCPTPHFFVFADDVAWASEHVRTKHPVTLVKGNEDYEDVILMSECRHQIVANSSFSWWGAWLNSNAAKCVVAPAKFMRDGPWNSREVYPAEWTVI